MRLQNLWAFISENCYLILIIWLLLFLGVRFRTLQNERPDRYYRGFIYVSAVGYFIILLYLTLLSRRTHSEMQMELAFLWEYRLALKGEIGWVFQILNNILLFVPMGVLYGAAGAIKKERKIINWKYALCIGVCSSFGIEVLQLILKLGLFELDDIFNNTIGMLLGFVFWKMSLKLKLKF